MYINIVKLDHDFNQKAFYKAISLLSNDRQKYFMRYKFIEDLRRSFIGHALVSVLLSKELGVPYSALDFLKTINGKPFVSNKNHLDFNISHSGNFVAACLSSKGKVGIDIEKLKNINFRSILNKFTKKERELIIQNNQINPQAFYTIWTLKESYLKYMGKGLTLPIDSINFLKIGEEISFNIQEPTKDIYFKTIYPSKNYVLSLCTDFKHDIVVYKSFEESYVYDSFAELDT
jgi:4'-phosphopantetheinyl transferase